MNVPVSITKVPDTCLLSWMRNLKTANLDDVAYLFDFNYSTQEHKRKGC